MENQLVPNNTTLASLRGLLRAARNNVTPEEAVYVELKMWHYDDNIIDGRINELIGVYRSQTGEGTQNFKSIKEAREYIDSWKEEENGNTNTTS